MTRCELNHINEEIAVALGWSSRFVLDSPHGLYGTPPGVDTLAPVPDYAGSAGGAGELINEIERRGWFWTISLTSYTDFSKGYVAEVFFPSVEADKKLDEYSEWADSPYLALCNAFLVAIDGTTRGEK